MQRIAHAGRPAATLFVLGLAFGLASTTPARAEVETFSIDSAHSFANWELRHVVARTSGTFHDIKGTVSLDLSNLAKSSVNAVISVYSLNSSHLRRDVHTLTDEFLDARNYPEMKFVSSSVSPQTHEKGTLTGQLSLHGVTKPVTMEYQILGFGPDPWGGMRAGFKATTRINRSDFGITKYTPTGPVGNEVDITLLIEGIKLDADGKPWNAKAAEKPKVISYPMPTQSNQQAAPVVIQQPVATPTPVPAPVTAPSAVPEKKESPEDQLKRKLKGLFN
jgi:polyisoprenoid-binding protein YceI